MAADNRNSPLQNVKPLSIATRTSLVAGLKAISQERWTDFVQVYLPLIRYWVRLEGVAESAVDDVVQECLTSFYTSICNFERQPTSKFRGWLRIIVQRRVADHFRGGSSDTVTPLDEMDHFSAREKPDPEEESPGARAVYREAALRACEIVRPKVAPKTWNMFWQSVVEQRPTADIAREHGVSQDAVRVARRRVRTRLRSVAIEEEDLGS